jgi:ribosomal protein S18 acetylase RimI-like enzyme
MAQIRRVVESDFAAAHGLLDQLMPAAVDLRRAIWSDTLAHGNYAAWIAELGGRPAGFVDLFVFPDLAHGRNIALVNNLVVDERFRRRGLGEELLQQAITHCRLHDVVELHLWTDANNTQAQRLYERTGFVRRAVLMELEM